MTRTKAKSKTVRLAEIEEEIRRAVPEWPNAPSLTLEQAKVLKPLLDERQALRL